jgi:carbon starvation protein
VLLLLAVWGGQFVASHANLAHALTFKPEPLAWTLIIYGFAASVLPIWLLLAPRDYLSTFMKLGTIFALACGIFLVLPHLQMPPLSRFIDGSGPVVPGKLFPFCFITIACGTISGFHTLIASGTTPKIMTRESHARAIGYGAMCLESMVAIMALIAACTLQPGVYLSMNIKGDPAATVAKVSSWGFPVTAAQMTQLATQSGEKTLFGRTGGAATLAVGMSQIFSKVVRGHGLDLWYHFAIMFEALFILTTLDAGTRVGRYLLQDILGAAWGPLGDTKNLVANVGASLLIVASWGYFLIQGVRDPLGGINSLWPLFGIANQLLAVVALCLATTVILKMQLAPENGDSKFKVGKPAFALVVLVPLLWLLTVTMTAGYEKIFSADPRIGFLAAAKSENMRAENRRTEIVNILDNTQDPQKVKGMVEELGGLITRRDRLQFNDRLDAAVTAFFLLLVGIITVISFREWFLLLQGKRVELHESEAMWLPEYAVAEDRPANVLGMVALGCALAKELSGEAHLERAQQLALNCPCVEMKVDLLGERKTDCGKSPEQLYVEMTEKRFDGINRCC